MRVILPLWNDLGGIIMKRVSVKDLQREAVENRGYANGYRDGYATGCTQGRQEGVQIGQRRLAQALLTLAEAPTPAAIAQIVELPTEVVESWRR
jgi:flagellar biosynthesis/type III secretory pathway protein FliH